MRTRVVVVALIRNKAGKYLINKMPSDRGVYPGQWAITGGGIEEGETMEEAVRREVKEEVGLELLKVEPWFFMDDQRVKIVPGKDPEELYMVYLEFKAEAKTEKVKMNEEFTEYAWVGVDEALEKYDLNAATRRTFTRLQNELV